MENYQSYFKQWAELKKRKAAFGTVGNTNVFALDEQRILMALYQSGCRQIPGEKESIKTLLANLGQVVS